MYRNGATGLNRPLSRPRFGGRIRQTVKGVPMKEHEIRFEGGNGLTMKTAIVIKGAQSELEGTYAAYSWLVQKFGDKDLAWKLISHSHGVFSGREIDTYVIELNDGSQKAIFFDCSDSFGKF